MLSICVNMFDSPVVHVRGVMMRIWYVKSSVVLR